MKGRNTCLKEIFKFSLFSILVVVLNSGCPSVATLETAKVGVKSDTADPYLNQIKISSSYPIVPKNTPFGAMFMEAQLKKIIKDNKMDFRFRGGTSGLGVSSKYLLLNKPLYLSLNGGAYGLAILDFIMLNGHIDLIISGDITKTMEIYTGCKLLSWHMYYPWAKEHDVYKHDYFTSIGGFIGFRCRLFTIEGGVHKAVFEHNNPFGGKDYIPFAGVSIPFKIFSDLGKKW